jgi:tetratricopeptide (TPR) repeat protein
MSFAKGEFMFSSLKKGNNTTRSAGHGHVHFFCDTARQMHKSGGMYIFLVLLLVMGVSAAPLFSQSMIQQMFSEGLQKEAEGDCLSAIFIFQDVLDINPYFADAKIALARCLYTTGNLNESEALLREVIHQERKNVQARNLLGRVLIALGRYDEAESVLREAVKLAPANIETRYGLADLYRAKGDHKKAVSIYNEILKVFPQEVWTYIYLGTSYTEMGELEKAGGFFRKAVSLDSTSSWTHINLARHYYQMGVKNSSINREDAEKFFDAAVFEAETALKIHQKNPEPHRILLDVYFFNNEWKKVIDEAEQIASLNGENSLLLYTMGFSAEMLEDLEQAEGYYAHALSKRIDDEVTRFRLENIVLALHARSLSEPKRLELAEFHHEKARFFLERNVMDKAFIHYKRAILLNPLNPEKRLEFADLLRIRGFWELYLHELKNILRDTLDVSSVDINDRIEIVENRVSKNLASLWQVDQYGEEESEPGFIPKTKTAVAVFDSFRSDYISEDFLHQRISKTISELLAYVLGYHQKIEVFTFRNEVHTRQDALRRARATGAQYYLIGAVVEKEDALKIRADLYSSFNGKIVQSFETYFTGNDKLFRSAVALASRINDHIPLRGLIARMEGNRVIINIGHAHGVAEDMRFHIIREGGLRNNPETGEFVTDPEVLLGTLTVTKVDEMISEGVYEYTGLYNRVNVYDNVVLIEEEKKTEEETRDE